MAYRQETITTPIPEGYIERRKLSTPPLAVVETPPMETQGELFDSSDLDKRGAFHTLYKYRIAVPCSSQAMSTLDSYLIERGDFQTSLGDIKRVMDTRENLLAKGYTILALIKAKQSNYEDWYRKTHPRPPKKAPPVVVYGI